MFPLDEDGVLRTERLVLRPARAGDAEALFRLFTWDVARWLSAPPWPYTMDNARDWSAQHAAWREDGPRGALFVTLEGDFIGCVDVVMKTAGATQSGDGPRMGWWIGEPFWGRGYVTEAAGAMIGRVFAAGDYPEIYCGAYADNAASLRVQEKLGFVRDGEDELFSRPRGVAFAHVETKLTREAWARRAAV